MSFARSRVSESRQIHMGLILTGGDTPTAVAYRSSYKMPPRANFGLIDHSKY